MSRYQHLITDDNRKWWTLGAMCLALFMVMLDNTVVNVALPSIQHASRITRRTVWLLAKPGSPSKIKRFK